MDRRACPSYEAGFDACDPLGSVLGWSGDSRAARVLRRRCRSEGVERSPFEDALRASTHFEQEYRRHYPNKSHITLNGPSLLDRFRHECALPAHNGDYFMAHEENRMHGFPSSFNPARLKTTKSPPRAHLVSALPNGAKIDDRLPKVEELLEKVDQEMLELTKQPLKSILNHPPVQKTMPQSILKKPKVRPHSESKSSMEGRRRQRAASESDNQGCMFRLSSPIPTFDNRLGYLSANNKRAKDNSGTGYSYGSAIASLNLSPMRSVMASSPVCKRSRSPNGRAARCGCKDAPALQANQPHVLRTTAINNDGVAKDDALVTGGLHSPSPGTRSPSPGMRSPTPTCPPLNSPALPVAANTAPHAAPHAAPPVKKKGAKKKKGKGAKAKLDNDEEEMLSRSPSPDCDWQMETDAVLAEIAQLERTETKAPVNTPNAGPPPVNISPNSVAVTSPTRQLMPKPPADPNMTANKQIVSKFVSGQKKKEDKERTKDSIFLTALYTNNPFKAYPTRKESPLCIPESVTNCLRISLFPRVPPYLKFVSHDCTAPLKIPNGIQKHLKWKVTTITPIVVKKTLTNSGFRLVKSECDTAECPQEETVEWIGIWGKHMKSIMFRAIKDGQKMNHFPGTFQIGRKDRLWRNLQKLTAKHGIKEFGIMPKTYVLPHDLKALKYDWEKHAANNEKWIIKPPASARGTGIKVVSRWTQIPKKRAVVVQKYVSKPYLINGSKFDLRLYVLVTSVHPLRIYLFKDGLARFASVKYNDEISSLNDRYMHLTNYSINRLSKNYTPNEDFSACEGHKWTLQSLFHYLKAEKGVNTQELWKAIKDLVIKTIISGEASISSLTKANITSRYNCYELFGIDVLLDEDLKPWLLEVNISPSLHSASPLDIHVKGPLVSEVLNIAQFQVPIKTSLDSLCKEKHNKLAGLPYDCRLYTVYLSKEERDKHIIYTNMEERDMYLRDILSTLTPDDVRHLIQAEDELTQAGDMERIFPTSETHKYLAYLAGPRYYNRLFDAWEARYSLNREPGLELLRNLCDIGYHLEVPPVPLKNDVDAPSPAASERPSLTSVEAVSSHSSTHCGDSAAPLPPRPPPVAANA